ncbi:TIGR03936 family radical SAM-associated protein [Chloroflexota bacterium]
MIQRLRIRFSRREEIKFISHLDMIRLWERAFRRAQVALAYSEGFSPHPRISLAAPLAVGVTSDVELMDVFIARHISPHWFIATTSRQLPDGIRILQVYPIALPMPSLQSQVRYVEYRVEIETEKNQEEIELAILRLLEVEHLPWQRERDTEQRNYDLRVLIDDLWLADYYSTRCTIGMRLRCDNSGSGRPEEVASALSFTHYPHSMHRIKLILTGNR